MQKIHNIEQIPYDMPEGYKAEHVGKGHDERWVEYYSDIKDRLIPDRTDDRCYGYHMSDEDFYIYITSHAYKHYSGSGTGLRTLMDFYAYLNAKGDTFNLDYIRTECKKHRDYVLREVKAVEKVAAQKYNAEL